MTNPFAPLARFTKVGLTDDGRVEYEISFPPDGGERGDISAHFEDQTSIMRIWIKPDKGDQTDKFDIGDRVVFYPVEVVPDKFSGMTMTTIGRHVGTIEAVRAGYYHVRLDTPWHGYPSVCAMPTELERV